MEGWVDLGVLMTLRPGIELATTGSEVQRPNRCATKATHDIVYLMYEAPDISTGLQDISPATLKFLMASIRSARSRQQLLSVPACSPQHVWKPCFFCRRTNSLEFTVRWSARSSISAVDFEHLRRVLKHTFIHWTRSIRALEVFHLIALYELTFTYLILTCLCCTLSSIPRDDNCTRLFVSDVTCWHLCDNFLLFMHWWNSCLFIASHIQHVARRLDLCFAPMLTISMTIRRSSWRDLAGRQPNTSHPGSCSSLKATAKWWFSSTDSSLYINANSDASTHRHVNW